MGPDTNAWVRLALVAAILAAVVGATGLAVAWAGVQSGPPPEREDGAWSPPPPNVSASALPLPTPSDPPYLGLHIAAGYETVLSDGVRGITVGVVRGAAADDAGIRDGDIVVAADGRQTPRLDDLAAQVRARRPGDVMELRVARSASHPTTSFALHTYYLVLGQR